MTLAKKIVTRIDEFALKFHKDKRGMELLQLAIVILIAVALIAVVGILTSNVRDKIQYSAEQVGNLSNDPNEWGK